MNVDDDVVVLAEKVPRDMQIQLELLDRQLKAGKFTAARETVKTFRLLVLLQEKITRELLNAVAAG